MSAVVFISRCVWKKRLRLFVFGKIFVHDLDK